MNTNEEKKENSPILTSTEIDVKIRQGKLELTNKNYSEAINIFKEIVESSSGHETLTSSAPSSAQSLICLIVSLTLVVKVFVIV